MALQKREKYLAMAVGVLVGVMLLMSLVSKATSALTSRRTQVADLRHKLEEKQFEQTLAQRAMQELAKWETESLPADLDLARSLYQNWLVATADAARLSQIRIEPSRATNQRGAYYRLPMALRARGSLEQTVRFMHAFYQAPHPHQLRDFTISPIPNTRDYELNLAIEALSLPGATRKTLSDGTSELLAMPQVQPYLTTITGRNLFAPYTPPPPPPRVAEQRPAPPPPPPPPPPRPQNIFDPAKFAVLTAIIAVEGTPQAWFNERTTGQTWRLTEGDRLEVGQFKGHITRIGTSQVEVESGGSRRIVQLGEPLHSAVDPAAGSSTSGGRGTSGGAAVSNNAAQSPGSIATGPAAGRGPEGREPAGRGGQQTGGQQTGGQTRPGFTRPGSTQQPRSPQTRSGEPSRPGEQPRRSGR